MSKLKKLIEENTFFRELIENSPDGVTISDTSGVIVFVSRRTAEIYGFESPDEIIGTNVSDYIAADDLQKAGRNVAEVMAGRSVKPEVYKVRKKKGDYFFVEIASTRILDDSREIIGMHSIIRDVTVRYRAERDIVDAEKKYRGLFENLSDAFTILEAIYDENDKVIDFKIIDVNPAFEKLTGKSAETVLNHNISDFNLNFDEGTLQGFTEVVEKNITLKSEYLANSINRRVKIRAFSPSEGLLALVLEDVTSEYRTKKDFSRSRASYRALFENAPVGIVTCDRGGKIAEANVSIAKILGSPSVEKTKSINILELPQLKDAGITSDFIRCFETGEEIRQVKEYKSAWGKKINLRYQLAPIFDDNRRVAYVQAIVEDFTTQKEAENELVESRNELELRNKISNAFLTIASDKVFSEVLQIALKATESQFGFFGFIDETGDLISPSLTYDIWDQCLVENKEIVFNRENWSGIWGKSLIEKRTIFSNEGLNLPKGHVVLKSAIAVPIMYGGEVIGQITVGDIEKEYEAPDVARLESICNYVSPILSAFLSERKHKQEREEALAKLAASEEKYRALVDGLSHPIAVYDRDANILLLNKVGLMNVATNLEDVIGRPLKDFIPENHEKTVGRVRDLFEKREPLYFQDKISIGGKDIWYQSTFQYLPNFDGKEAAQVVSYDITEIKRYEKELIEAKERAEESDRLKSSFLANMSHEIRTPLNGILGFAQLICEEDVSSEERGKFAEVVKSSGEQLLNIINDIIDISKIEAGKIEVKPINFDANRALDEALGIISSNASAKGLTVFVGSRLGADEKFINTDKGKLLQALNNFLSNAVKFTDSGTIEIGVTRLGDRLRFYCSDTGIGMDKEKIQLIFERFRQIDEGDTRKYGGAGLGLAISKALVEIIGGKVWAESKPGLGSTFFIEIPYVAAEKPDYQPAKLNSKLSSSDLSGKVALVVEDETSNFLFLKNLLVKSGIDIIRARNGNEAIEKCANVEKIDFVLMDLKMPEKSGYAAAREIKTMRPTLPIIAQTAYARPEDRRKALDAGCDDYVAKPIPPELLIRKIKSCLS